MNLSKCSLMGKDGRDHFGPFHSLWVAETVTPDEALSSLCSGANVNSEGRTINGFLKSEQFSSKKKSGTVRG